MQAVRSSSLPGSTGFSPSGFPRIEQKLEQRCSEIFILLLIYPHGLQDLISLQQVQRNAHSCRSFGQIMLSDAGAASRDRQMICPHQWCSAPDQCAESFRQTPLHAEQGPRH